MCHQCRHPYVDTALCQPAVLESPDEALTLQRKHPHIDMLTQQRDLTPDTLGSAHKSFTATPKSTRQTAATVFAVQLQDCV